MVGQESQMVCKACELYYVKVWKLFIFEICIIKQKHNKNSMFVCDAFRTFLDHAYIYKLNIRLHLNVKYLCYHYTF